MRRPTTTDLMLLVTVLLWSLNFTVTKYVLTHGFHPLAFSVTRYAAAATIFATITVGRERSLSVRSRRDVVIVCAAAGVGIWLNQLSYVYAIHFTTASTVALILGTTPIFAAVFAWAVRLERLSRRFWIAAAVSFAGVALVAVGKPGAGVSTDLTGDVLAVATAATWAAYSVAITPLMRRYSPFRVSALVLLIGWIPLALTGAKQVFEQDYSLTPSIWALFAYATLGPLVITNVLWFTAIGRVGPARATLFANIQPFFAAVFALLLLSEKMSAVQVVGALGIGAGIVLAGRRARAQAVAPEVEPAQAA